ncbi:MAG: energy transducer TonB [Bacteroidetes bacterium]|nr:energy transducer TonB [Bacteroidota bacterium]
MKNIFILIFTLFTASISISAFGQRDPVGKSAMAGGDGPGPVAKGEDTPQIAEIQARFPGGDSAFAVFVRNNFEYPFRCLDSGISGYVKLRFIVDKTGRISDIRATEETKACPEFTQEAMRVLRSSPKWIPGQVNGKFVKSYRQVPIRLSLE